MPTYNFKCKKCGEEWEQILTIKDIDVPLNVPCSHCDTIGNIVRLISPVALGQKQADLKGLSKRNMDPIVRERLEKIKNRSDISKETSKIDF